MNDKCDHKWEERKNLQPFEVTHKGWLRKAMFEKWYKQYKTEFCKYCNDARVTFAIEGGPLKNG